MSQFFSWQHAIIKSDMPSSVRHVCLTIGCHMAMDGSGCFPSYKTIAEETGLSVRTAMRGVADAAAAGYLVVVPRFSEKNGAQTSNTYRIAIPEKPVDKLGTSGGGGDTNDRGGVTQTTGGGVTPVSPLLTPQYEHPKGSGQRDREEIKPLTPNPNFFMKSVKPATRNPYRGTHQHRTLAEWLASNGLTEAPLDWLGMAGMIMRSAGADPTGASRQLHRFNDYYLRGPGATYTSEDWASEFTKWLRKSDENRRGGNVRALGAVMAGGM